MSRDDHNSVSWGRLGLLMSLGFVGGPGCQPSDDKGGRSPWDSEVRDSEAQESAPPDSAPPDSAPPDSPADTGGSGGDTGDSSADSGASEVRFAAETLVSDALARVVDDEANGDLGRVVRTGDVTGDGQPDVVAATFLAQSQTGGAYAIPGPVTTSGAAQDLGLHLVGAARGGGTGRSMSLGDLDGDGYLDIGLGAPYAGANNGAYVAFGPLSGDLDLGDPTVAHLKGPASTYAGHGSDVAGDLNDDGVADAVVGAYYTSSQKGLTFVAYGPVAADLDLATDADARLEGEGAAVYAGRSVRAGPDLDGDGFGDLVIAALGTLGPPASGGFYVVSGPPDGEIDLADAAGRYAGETTSANAGLWVDAGDLDGDGLADVVASAFDSTLATTGGAAYVVLGPASADTSLAAAELIVRGDVAGQYGGGVTLDDLDGDGTAELLLGAQGDPTRGVGAGAVYLFEDPAPGSYVYSDGDAAFFAEGPGDNLGAGMAMGDVDGDLQVELILSAPYVDTAASKGGAFYVMHGV